MAGPEAGCEKDPTQIGAGARPRGNSSEPLDEPRESMCRLFRNCDRVHGDSPQNRARIRSDAGLRGGAKALDCSPAT